MTRKLLTKTWAIGDHTYIHAVDSENCMRKHREWNHVFLNWKLTFLTIVIFYDSDHFDHYVTLVTWYLNRLFVGLRWFSYNDLACVSKSVRARKSTKRCHLFYFGCKNPITKWHLVKSTKCHFDIFSKRCWDRLDQATFFNLIEWGGLTIKDNDRTKDAFTAKAILKWFSQCYCCHFHVDSTAIPKHSSFG